MTEMMKTIVYRYSVRDAIVSGWLSDFLIVPPEQRDYYLNPEDEIDSLIGGVAHSINHDNHHVVYQIYDIQDESVFDHPSVLWWTKEVIEKEVTVTKLPTGGSRNINWKSRNRGGGVRHKNFDKAATKPYKPYTETPKQNKEQDKVVNEPPKGIMSIIKKEDS
jgi:hypothetical protein